MKFYYLYYYFKLKPEIIMIMPRRRPRHGKHWQPRGHGTWFETPHWQWGSTGSRTA